MVNSLYREKPSQKSLHVGSHSIFPVWALRSINFAFLQGQPDSRISLQS